MSDIDFDILEERGYRYVCATYYNWRRRRDKLKDNYNNFAFDHKKLMQAHRLIHRLMKRIVEMERRAPPLINKEI